MQKALNVKRGELNRKLSYIPICVAGTYTALDENRESNNHLIDSDCTKVFDVVDSVKNNLTTRLTEHFKGEESKYPDLLGIKMQGFDRKMQAIQGRGMIWKKSFRR